MPGMGTRGRGSGLSWGRLFNGMTGGREEGRVDPTPLTPHILSRLVHQSAGRRAEQR